MPELAFLFDMDGVIVDSNPTHRVAWDEYNRRFGVEMTEAMYQSMYGKRNDEIIRGYLGDHLTDAEVFEHGALSAASQTPLHDPGDVADDLGPDHDLSLLIDGDDDSRPRDVQLPGLSVARLRHLVLNDHD